MASKLEIDSALRLVDVLEDQRVNAEHTDVVLVCKDKDFPAHKFVLKTTSEYFRTMFRSPEWNHKNHKEGKIELPTVSAAEMDIILPYLYTRKFVDVDNASLLQDLLKSSHMMQIIPLFENCGEKLCDKLTTNNFLEILNLVQFYDNDNMKKLVLNFLTKHFTAVTKSEEFLELDAFQLITIIHRLNTRKSPMDNIVKGLIRWAEHKRDRQDTLLDILTTLDLKEMSTDYLMELLSSRALVKKNYQVVPLLTAEATTRMFSPNRKRIVCIGEKEKKQVFAMYDIEQKQWSETKQLPFDTEAFTRSVWLDGFVYFVGKGCAGNLTQSSQIIKYNPVTNNHTTVHLAIPVCLAGLGVLNKSIYIVNGVNENNEEIKTVQCYNPATGDCELLANTNNPNGFPYILCFSNYLYVVGVRAGNSTVERYDTECDEWTTVTNIPISVDFCRAAIVADKLYIVQIRATNECHVYDLTANSWTVKMIEEPQKGILNLFSTSLEGNHILVVLDDARTLYFCDAESGKCSWKTTANMEIYFDRRSCIT